MDDPEYGSVTGTIKVWKTKVSTVGDKSGKEVVVYLEDLSDRAVESPVASVVMDQKGLVFVPHVLPVLQGTTVEFLNNDTVEHNIYLLSEKTGQGRDLGTWQQGVSVSHRFTEKDVVIVLCKLHLEMAAYVVVLDTPYFTTAIIDEKSQEATFRLTNIPPGEYFLKVWHKKLRGKGGARKITVGKGEHAPVPVIITKKKYAK